MPPTSREAFLTTVRRSLGRAGTTAPPSNGALYVEAASSISPQTPDIDCEQLISRFAEEVKKVHGVVTRVSGQDELSALLGALIEEKGIRKIVRWDTAALSSLDPALMTWVILILSTSKFMLVVGYFMHLKFDDARFSALFFFPFFIMISIAAVLLALFLNLTR